MERPTPTRHRAKGEGQEPLYSLSWQATIRPGKRVSLAPRFVTEPQQRKVGRDPLFSWKRPRHLPQWLSHPFCRRQLWHG